MHLPVVKIRGEEPEGILQNSEFLKEQFRLVSIIAFSPTNVYLSSLLSA
jgi:hypothetical protein